jgi:ATP-dependent Lon protease
VIIPKENKKDLEEIPENAKAALSIHPVETIDEVLTIALENPPEGVEILPQTAPIKVKKSRSKATVQ